MIKINNVTILGANGTMGPKLAGIFSSFGKANVFLISRTLTKSQTAVERAVKSVRSDSIRKRLIPKTYEDLEECIKKSDWIFESVSEKNELKNQVNLKINRYRKKNTIVTTGTSGLSINDLKNSFDEKGQSLYFGTHFFNPPYKLPLCELIPSSTSDKKVTKELKEYLEKILYRKVIMVKDKPAFLANRIGFQFLNDSAKMAEEYKEFGGIDYIDSIVGPFTGRALPPLLTIDFVGLDIHGDIIENLYENTDDLFHDSFILPDYLIDLISEEKLGKKSGEGLFKTIKASDGRKKHLVYDLSLNEYREKRNYDFKFAKKMVTAIHDGMYDRGFEILNKSDSQEAEICKYLLFKHVIYSAIISNEVASSEVEADLAMSYGFNWIPPSSLTKLIGGKEQLLEELEKNSVFKTKLPTKKIEKVLDQIGKKSDIDYRKFLMARS